MRVATRRLVVVPKVKLLQDDQQYCAMIGTAKYYSQFSRFIEGQHNCLVCGQHCAVFLQLPSVCRAVDIFTPQQFQLIEL
jgi:hypothetical protein